jgi:hypothetical protein
MCPSLTRCCTTPAAPLQGRLAGLVTSNARHSSGATLPHLSFCIAAHELQPVLVWAQARGQGPGLGALRALDRDDAEGAR